MVNLAPIPAAFAFGQVDSTSTSTVFTATVPGVAALYDGLCVYLKNGVVASASGWTLNINGLGAKPVYSTLSAASRTTTIFNSGYTMLFIYNSSRVEGGCWDIFYGYNSDTNTIAYNIRDAGSIFTMKNKLTRYGFAFTAPNGRLVCTFTGTYTTATTKTLETNEAIDPLGEVYYYSTTTVVSAGSEPSSTYLYIQYTGADTRYAFNKGSTLTAKNPVYVRLALQSDGTAKLDGNDCLVTALPSTEDGKLYKLLGIASDTYKIMLLSDKPVFYYKDGRIRRWLNTEDFGKVAQTQGNTPSYSYWRPLLVGASSNANEGFTPESVEDKSYTFDTLQVQPSTGTFRGCKYAAVDSNSGKKSTISAGSLTDNRDVTLPDKSGTLAMTDDIEHLPAVTASDNGKVLMVVNGAWAAASLPVYQGGVS